MFRHKQTILYIAIIFSIGSKNVFKSFVICEGVEGTIECNRTATFDWEDKHIKKARGYHPKSAVITNDVAWYDDTGELIKANRCGTISQTKINGEWYMVGSEAHRQFYHGGDIYLYKSATLGSDSWHRVKMIHDFGPYYNATSASCEIIQRYDDENVVILHCRRKVFISYTGVEGEYIRHTSFLPESTVKNTDGSKLKFGGSSTYQESNDLYLVVSGTRTKIDGKRTRSIYIYKFNESWTAIDYAISPVTWSWNTFESPMVTKMGRWYYIFASKTHGWKQSKTYYRRAGSLESLADAKTSEVVMHPADTNEIKSMGSQFCFFQKFAAGKWMFGGRRHPTEAPEIFAEQYGKYVMAPARFIKGVPHVYWKYSFDWRKYNYRNPSNDRHVHYGYGHESVPCADSTGKFWVQFSKANRKGERDCGWLDDFNFHQRRKKCNKHRELQIKCPVSCKTFGC